LTDADRDFNAPASTNVNAFLADTAKQKTLCVIKKNSFRLKKLLKWISDANANVLRSCPTMIIDDEADLASPNTAKDAEERTKINGLLVNTLKVLPKVTYIGYTATPFANVLIDPRDPEDLYPRHFIIDLPKPKGYYGPESIFGREPLNQEDNGEDFDGLDMVRDIASDELPSLRPDKSQNGAFSPQVTPSLRRAILYFWMATAARYARGQKNSHSTMLIHTTAFAGPQKQLADSVSAFCKTIGGLLAKNPGNCPVTKELQEIWNDEQPRVVIEGLLPVPFEEMLKHIPDVLSRNKVVVENYLSPREARLVYGDDPGVQVVIGGNVLSRGLTLKGLIVSFFVRNASAYDTLLQMGRWFGFRRGYADLPRIWMTKDLKGYFYDLATVEEEIRRDIKVYEADGRTPTDFGIRIRSHSDLMVTAKLKMQHAIECDISYDGEAPQTTVFKHLDKDWLDTNIKATKQLISEAVAVSGQPQQVWPSYYLIKNIPVESILRFLSSYGTIGERMRRDLLIGYINAQNNEPGKNLLKWNIAVVSKKKTTVGSLDLGFGDIPLINRARLKGLDGDANLKAIMSPTDIGVDLIPDKSTADKVGHDSILAMRQTNQGHPGLILLYPISKDSIPSESYKKTRVDLAASQNVIAMAIHFPWTGKNTPQKYYTVDLSGVEREEEEQFLVEDDNE